MNLIASETKKKQGMDQLVSFYANDAKQQKQVHTSNNNHNNKTFLFINTFIIYMIDNKGERRDCRYGQGDWRLRREACAM
jgi:hypothetical protein